MRSDFKNDEIKINGETIFASLKDAEPLQKMVISRLIASTFKGNRHQRRAQAAKAKRK